MQAQDCDAENDLAAYSGADADGDESHAECQQEDPLEVIQPDLSESVDKETAKAALERMVRETAGLWRAKILLVIAIPAGM